MTTDLYNAFLSGDEQAFEELVRIYRRPLTAFLQRFVSDYDTAEDLAADVFVVILERKGYRPGGSFRAWLFAVARHKAIDHIRKQRHLLPLETAENVPDCKANPEETLLTREQRKAARTALGYLKDDRRMALLLTAREGLSYEEAATVMHKTPTQIRNLCYRARQQLRSSSEEVFDYEN